MRCEHTWLLVNQCGHCLGVQLDPELEEVAASNIQQGNVTR